MASTSETGHSKNVANMDELASFTLGYGPAYNPTKTSIKTDSLHLISTIAKKAIDEVNRAMPLYSNAVADREATFIPVSKLVTRVLNALKATDTTSQVIANAKTLIRKIQGQRATPKKTPEQKKALEAAGKEVVEISSSQLSFNSRMESFDRLIKLLINVPLYGPNEAELTTDSLTTLLNNLRDKNSAVLSTVAPLSNARLERNNILYKTDTGLVDIAMDAKFYIKSLFGATSPQFKQVSKLEFRKYLT